MDLTFVMPVYNEADNLPAVLADWISLCKENGYRLIVVNDGSTDNSKKIIESFAHESCVSIINHKVNRGYGAALKTGISRVTTKLVMTIDSDGQHISEEVQQLLEMHRSTDADLIIGCRKSSHDTFFRHFGKWIIRKTANILVRQNIKDLNSGMKLFNTEIVQSFLVFCPDSMAFSDVITLAFVDKRHLVAECPIESRDRTVGTAKTSVWTGFETIIDLLYIVVLFHPMRLMLPLSIFFLIVGFSWGLPIVLRDRGVSVGSMLCIMTGIITFYAGMIAEQISHIVKRRQ